MGSSKHNLGFGLGQMIDNGDGKATYQGPLGSGHRFTVRIADVTGFSSTKGKGALDYHFHVYGNGTTLATLPVGGRLGQKIEEWFRAHPDFGASSLPVSAAPGGPDLAEQLANLASLRESGALTDAEFEQAKARLLS